MQLLKLTLSSKRSTVANCDVAVTASMLLIIASWNAERNAAASKPKSSDEADEEKDPAEASSSFVNYGHASLSTFVAGDLARVVWEMSWVAITSWSLVRSWVLDVDYRLRLHHWLTWLTWLHWLLVLLLHHWLTWLHWLLVWLGLCVWCGDWLSHEWLLI